MAEFAQATAGFTGRVGSLLARSRQPVGAAQIAGGQVVCAQVAGGPANALFQAGSISKSVTACAVVEMARTRGIDLDGNVNEYLHSWQLPGTEPVTIRRLLNHTAGITVPFFPGYEQGGPLPTLHEVLNGAGPATNEAVRSNSAMLGRFLYSGGGYVILQALVADVMGCDFAEAARSLVLQPLGMTESTFQQPLPDDLRDLAARDDWHIYPEAAAAGLWTTPLDLGRYVAALLCAARGSTASLAASTANAMLQPTVSLPSKGEWNVLPLLGVRAPTDCGLGLFLHPHGRFSHLGTAWSFFAMFTGSLEDMSGGVVMYAGKTGLYPFRLLRAMSRQFGWHGFDVPLWERASSLRAMLPWS